jgi:hypothetical protein
VGFVCDRRLEDLLDPDALPAACRAIAAAGGRALRDDTRAATPVEEDPEPDRARRPGTLRAGIDDGPVREVLGRFEVRVRSAEPLLALWVDKGTRPHVIRARRPGGRLRFRGASGDIVFRREVRHPGTQGARMFARGALATRGRVQAVAAPALRRFAVDLVGR